MQEPLGHPHATHVDRDARLEIGPAERKLGRAAADVDDEKRRVRRFEFCRRAEEAQTRLVLPTEQLRCDAEQLGRRAEEVVAVRCVTRRRGGRRPDTGEVVAIHHPAELTEHVQRAGNGVGIKAACCIHTRPEARNPHQTFVAVGAVPDEESHGVGTAVDCRIVRHEPPSLPG